jgi:hypothetical protein
MTTKLERPQNHFAGFNIRILTPQGKINVVFMEDNSGKLVRILAFAGKSGLELQAWVDSLCTLINHALENDTLNAQGIIELLSGIYTGSRVKIGVNRWVYGGVDGIVTAFKQYIKEKDETRRPTYRVSPRV